MQSCNKFNNSVITLGNYCNITCRYNKFRIFYIKNKKHLYFTIKLLIVSTCYHLSLFILSTGLYIIAFLLYNSVVEIEIVILASIAQWIERSPPK